MTKGWITWTSALVAVLGTSSVASADEPTATTTADPMTAEAATVEEQAPTTKVEYKHGFVVEAGDAFSLKLQARVQTRYAFESLDEMGSRDEETSFAIQRARLKVSGNAYVKQLKYKFQMDLGKGNVVLKDFFIDYKFSPAAHVRVGQWKRPFSRQQINSSGKLELVDRAITDKAFGGGRDIGVAIHNNYEKSPKYEWAAGVFNGMGDKPRFSGDVTVDMMTGEGEVTGGGFSNVPNKFGPALVGRIGYNHNGVKGYSEADLEGGPLRFGVGASALAELDVDEDDSSHVRGEVDYIAKVNGFATSGGVYLQTDQDGAGFGDQAFSALGFYTQAGYVLQGRYQPSVRYAYIAADGADNDVQEATVGFSVYFFGHSVKWQTDGSMLMAQSAAESLDDYRVRTQVQFAF